MAESQPHPCPEEIMLNIAFDGVTKRRGIHRAPDQALGGITLYLECLEMVREMFPCEGIATNEEGQFTCPLAEMSRSAMARMTGTWPPGGCAMQLEKVVAPEDSPPTDAGHGNAQGPYM